MELRRTFDRVAPLYERARPTYPGQLFDALTARGLLDGAVVEIGPGTGQATRELIRRGSTVTAVELGPDLARILAEHRWAQEVAVVVGPFEDWVPQRRYDAVLSFTAWHWVDPAVRAVRVARALRPGGALVTVTTQHVKGGTEGFFEDNRACYARWTAAGADWRPPPVDSVPVAMDEIDEDPHFGPAERLRFVQSIDGDTAGYLDVLRTYSDILALSEASRTGLLDCLRRLIDSSYDGHVAKAYLHEMRITRLAAP